VISRDKAPLFAALALLTVLGACGEIGEDPPAAADPSSSGTTSPAATAADVVDGPKVELIDAGAEPRESLRAEVREGDTQRASMTMLMSVRTRLDGKKYPATSVPAMVMGMQMEVTDVSDDGVIEADFGYDEVSVRGSGAEAKAMEKALRPLTGVAGHLQVTDTGRFIDGDLEIPSDMDPTMRSTMSSIESQLQNLIIPFPDEAVGAGATWTSTAEMELNGIAVRNVTHYELVEWTSDGAVLSSRLEQTAPEQDADLPGMPAGSSVHVEHLESRGTGRTVYDPRLLVPVSSQVDMESDSEMTIEENGRTGRLEQMMKMRIELAPR
jgi:hypothetical protein